MKLTSPHDLKILGKRLDRSVRRMGRLARGGRKQIDDLSKSQAFKRMSKRPDESPMDFNMRQKKYLRNMDKYSNKPRRKRIRKYRDRRAGYGTAAGLPLAGYAADRAIESNIDSNQNSGYSLKDLFG